jgi:hypothetical protein
MRSATPRSRKIEIRRPPSRTRAVCAKTWDPVPTVPALMSREVHFAAAGSSMPAAKSIYYFDGTRPSPSRFAKAARFESQQAKKMGP